MKYINIPQPIKVNEGLFTLQLFIRWLIDNDQRFTVSAAAMRRAVRIDSVITQHEHSSVLPLEHDDHALLSQVAQQPVTREGVPTYPLTRPRVLLPFIDAIVNATESPES